MAKLRFSSWRHENVEKQGLLFSSVQFGRVWLCNPMDCSTPGCPVHHQVPQLAQTHVQWVTDAIQSPHPLSSPSPPAFNPSRHQGLFQWVGSLHQVAKVLEPQLQSVLPMNIQDWFPLGSTGLISHSPRDFQESSPTPQFESINFSSLSFLYGPTLTSIRDYWKNHSFDYMDLCRQSNVYAV